jgi:hypothetical protein
MAVLMECAFFKPGHYSSKVLPIYNAKLDYTSSTVLDNYKKGQYI